MLKTLSFVIFAFLFLTNSSFAYLKDPFYNPLNQLIERKIKEKEFLNKKKAKLSVEKVRLFKPVLPYPFNRFVLEGVIREGGGSYKLVLLEPESGKVFLLKEGDPISENEKIVKISPEKVGIAVYYRKRGKLFKKLKFLKLNKEDLR